MAFTATTISIYEELGVIVVGFSDDEQSPSQCLLLQRILQPTQQDRKLMQDRLHLQTRRQPASGYVDVEQAVLTDESLSIQLSTRTARDLGIDANIEIQIPRVYDELPSLKAALRKLFNEDRLLIESD
jgi:hypothetical protein